VSKHGGEEGQPEVLVEYNMIIITFIMDEREGFLMIGAATF
jgi:hypothetical protein